MAFPATPLPLVVALAPGADPISPATWNFQDITTDVRESAGLTIQVGRQDESGQVDATQVRMQLAGSTGRYTRTNPSSDLYGLLDRGSPIQPRITRVNDTFGRTTSPGWGTEPTSGLTWTHTGTSSWATTGAAGTYTAATANVSATALLTAATGHDVDITSTASVPAVMTGAAWVHATMVRYQDTANLYRLHTEFTTAGTIGVKIVRTAGGVSTDLTSVISTGVSYSAGTRIRTRVRAVGATLQIRCWLESGSEPTVWHAQVDDDDVTGTQTGVLEWRVIGNTNVGSLTVTVDDWRVDIIRATTPVPEWPVRWDQSGRSVTAPITGAGILRRLGQGQDAVRSPMYRQVTQYSTLVGHWPMEDPSGSAALTNTVVGGKAGTITTTELGQSDRPPGAAGSAKAVLLSIMSGQFLPASTSAGWQFAFSMKLAQAAPVIETEVIRWTTSNGLTWSWRVSSTTYRLTVTQADVTVATASTTFGTGINPTDWISYRVKVSVSGGTVTVEVAWFSVDIGATGFTTSYSGTPGALATWRQAANDASVDALTCHVFGVTGVADDLQSYNAQASFNGYAGEIATSRLARLSVEAGVPMAIIGTSTTAMGPQSIGSYLDLVREVEAADLGLVYERGAGLGYLAHSSRRNQTAAMVLDMASGHIAEPPEPVDDDQRLRNKVKVARTGGSEVTVTDPASIAKSGTWPDDVTVNLASDSQLPHHAGWRLHLGTIDELRWPRISLNLARQPSLIASWCSVRVGSRITIANPPAAVATGQGLDLIVEGWVETLGPFQWDVDLVCSPARPWDVGVYDSSAARYDSGTTTLQSTVAAGVTSLVLTFGKPGEGWSTAAASQPYDLLIAGERIRVPVGGMGAITGSGPCTQPVTGATRAINGIAKSLPAGSEVHIATPGRYAL
jgi:hypothetical protein